MRLVIDINVMISALLSSKSLPAHLIVLWRATRPPCRQRSLGRPSGP
jgi:hypothetical protein